ncbi:hypothetical protein D3C71_1778900 [compost metagenome]
MIGRNQQFLLVEMPDVALDTYPVQQAEQHPQYRKDHALLPLAKMSVNGCREKNTIWQAKKNLRIRVGWCN